MNTIYLQYILYSVISYRLFSSLGVARLIYTVSQYIQQDINFSCMFKVNVTIKAVY